MVTLYYFMNPSVCYLFGVPPPTELYDRKTVKMN